MRKAAGGGPAFPTEAKTEINNRHEGMSLRDYLAAKAMPLAFDSLASGHEHFERIAAWSYELADAMLKARSA